MSTKAIPYMNMFFLNLKWEGLLMRNISDVIT